MFNPLKRSTRLGHWDGQRQSIHEDWLPLPRMERRAGLIRISLVVATAILLTVITSTCAPPVALHIGENSTRDIRARVAFSTVNLPQTERLREEVQDQGKVTSPVEAREVVPPVIEQYSEGTPLVKRGQPITPLQFTLLHEEERAYQHSLSAGDAVRLNFAEFLIHLLICSVVAVYVVSFQPALLQNMPRLLGMCGQTLLTVALALLLSRSPWHAAAVPLTVTAMVFAIAFNPPFALLMSFSISLITTIAMRTGIESLTVHIGGLAAAVLLLRGVRTRSRLLRVSLAAGATYALLTLCNGITTEQTVRWIAFDAGRYLVWALLAGFILSGSLPLVERGYGIVTDVTLLELADSSHPLLQELIRRAPGTYTHSMTMATLADAAAEAIGANPLLSRVGCYFHDVGKMLKPHYFIENQLGENRHDTLEPALSTLVIIGHVKDGMALAEQYRLPRPVADFIQQHHGTTLVEYFYREAIRLRDENGHGSGELEFAFRYPGPKPQSREIGIVMLADAVESASRALPMPTPNSLRKLVHDLIMKRLLDGQFDESGLTLTELHRIEESLCKSVVALYHARIRYPEELREAS